MGNDSTDIKKVETPKAVTAHAGKAFAKHFVFDAANKHVEDALLKEEDFQKAVQLLVDAKWGISWYITQSVQVELGITDTKFLDKLLDRK